MLLLIRWCTPSAYSGVIAGDADVKRRALCWVNTYNTPVSQNRLYHRALDLPSLRCPNLTLLIGSGLLGLLCRSHSCAILWKSMNKWSPGLCKESAVFSWCVWLSLPFPAPPNRYTYGKGIQGIVHVRLCQKIAPFLPSASKPDLCQEFSNQVRYLAGAELYSGTFVLSPRVRQGCWRL